jgi:predicted permease
VRWLINLVRRHRIHRELGDEVEAHLEERVADLVESGMREAEARQQAAREFGNATLYLEISRETWGWTALDRLWRDVRYAWRTLHASPLFTLTAIVSLALGIGANTAVFTLLYGSLWKPLPVRDPQQIFHLMRKSSIGDANGEFSYSYPLFQQLCETARPVGELFGKAGSDRRKFGVNGVPDERVAGEGVSDNFFSALLIKPFLGRVLESGDDSVLGGRRVAVLSHDFWTRRFQSNPSILGKTILYSEKPYTVVGVAQPGFTGVDAEVSIDVWVPMTTAADKPWLTWPDSNWIRVLVRLHPGVAPARAQALLDGVFRAHVAEKLLPGTSPHWKPVLETQHATLRPASSGLATTGRQFRKTLLLLLAVVALVLLISCANVANLMLARNAARQQEMSVRLALGASRARIVSQLFTESLLLSLAGGAGGVLLATWGTTLLVSLLPQSRLQLAFDFGPDFTVLGFTAAIAMASAMLFGLAPALRACQGGALTLGSGQRTTGRSIGGRLLVAGQLALSLLLLVGAGLFLGTLRNLKRSDLGFRPEHVVTFDLSFPAGTAKDRIAQSYTQIKERIESHPGVIAASYFWPSIYEQGGWSVGITAEGHPETPGEDNDVGAISAGPGFFEALGLRLLQGRYLNAQDIADKPPVVVVNESLARSYFGNASPIGHRIRFPWRPPVVREIVGVVGDAKHYGVREKTWRMVYVPTWKEGSFLVRANVDPRLLSGILREEVPAVDKLAQIEQIRPLETIVDNMVFQERLTATLSTGFGVLALLLAAIGLYGVMAYAVSRRTNELGIRMALGAQRRDVQWLVLRESIRLILMGIAIGLTAAIALTRALSSVISGMLYGIKPTDVPVFAGSVLLLVVVAVLAGFLPAWRASRTDPMVALRHE